VYTGDASFSGSKSSAASVTAKPDNTKTALPASPTSPASPVWGEPITFTAQLTGLSAGAGGSVTFLDGGVVLATVNVGQVTKGTAQVSFTTSALAVGSHALCAAYSGSGNSTPSAGSLTQAVGKAKTIAALKPVSNVGFGQSVTFTAVVSAVTPGAGTPTGTVTFLDRGNVLGTGNVQVVNGVAQASFTPTAPLPPGGQSITAVHAGDSSFKASTTAGLPETVNPAATATVVSSFADPSVAGGPVTFLVTVTAAAPGSGSPAGKRIYLPQVIARL
jgi:hypothetical protein